LIIICDAEADENYQFAGLGNAIRKCRIDLGINIDLNVDAIRPTEPGGPCAQHFAIGDIHYEMADEKAPLGKIIYFKSSLKESDSTDVKNYKKNHPTFPHETTANQWFTESQFESYRQLGIDVVFSSIFDPPPPPPTAIADALTTICKGGSGAPAVPAAKNAEPSGAPQASLVGVESNPQAAIEKIPKNKDLGEIFRAFGFETTRVTVPTPKPAV
jgi:hypothetical protein